MADNKSRGLDTEKEIERYIKGLKAIQREAKKATQALREQEKAERERGYDE